ncbi:hypothetical protein E9993_19945 [Labilibacter sediminis]|nr:hypothetical protein E9993_19945 [Labilibacter sediminis]
MKIKRQDYILIGISAIAVIGLILSCINMLLPVHEYGSKGFDPFRDYYTNKGIVLIFIARLIFWLTVCVLGIIWIKNKTIKPLNFNLLLLIILIIALIHWFELWYGSTFYYGEVRDKQGLGVPILCIVLQIYVLLRLGLTKKTLIIGLIALIIIMNYGIYSLVYENWGLYHDFYFPGTNIPIW